MVSVAVTGVSGLIGRRLVSELDADDTVDRVLGLDVTPPRGLASPKVAFRQTDIRDPDLPEVLDVDVLVHLAFLLDPIQDEEHMRDVNVFGTRNVFEAAATADVDKVVYLSSATVYGAHPDNPLPLDETAPLRANPDLSYAEHKMEIEEWLAPWSEQHPELTVTVLRPALVAGPGVDNFISRQFEQPRFPVVRGHRPPWQFVHPDDVAGAISHAIHHELPGPYNVAAEGWLSFDEVAAIGERKLLWLPEEVAFGLAETLWNLGLGESPPGQVHYVMHPWVVDVDKLMATGWRPRHSNREALADLVEEHRDRLTLLGRTVSRSTLRTTAATGGAVVGLALLRRLWRRWGGASAAPSEGADAPAAAEASAP